MKTVENIKKSLYIIIFTFIANFIINIVLVLIEVLSDYNTSLNFSVAIPFIIAILGIITLLIEFIALMMANKDNANIYHASRAVFVSLVLHVICFVLRLILYFYEENQVYYNEPLVITFWVIFILIYVFSVILEIFGSRYILSAIDDVGRRHHIEPKGSNIVFTLFITYEVIDVASIIAIIFSYYMTRNLSIVLNFSFEIALIFVSLLCALGLLFLTKRNFNIRLNNKDKK